MSKILVKKSLYKFLDDNLDYYITYDSNNANLKTIPDLSVSTPIVAPFDELVLYNNGNIFNTVENIEGFWLYIYDENDIMLIKKKIIGFNQNDSHLYLDSDVTFDIDDTNKITILSENLIYLKSMKSMVCENTRFHSLGQKDRFDLYVKVRDDGTKDKIDTLLQDLRNVIFSNNGNFKIYDDFGIEVGHCTIDVMGYEEIPLMDIASDVQSFLVSFVGKYFINYKN